MKTNLYLPVKMFCTENGWEWRRDDNVDLVKI